MSRVAPMDFSWLEPDLVAGGDRDYFVYHRPRFERTLESLQRVMPHHARVLDIGSHYLHVSSTLARLGHQVTAMDVAAFQQLPFVRRRAETAGIRLETVGDLGAGDFLADAAENSYDVVIFCEILEHITFHPALFWKRVYEVLKPGGLIFLSTPNSLRIANWVKAALRLLARRGVGISVNEIFGHVTFGHHWKEFSSTELRDYFARLSPDFQVDLRYMDPGLPRGRAATVLQWLGNPVPALRPSLEAIVRLPKKERWIAQARKYDE